ncbi:MAG: DUF3842 family protein [Clostridiales bacterium]|nr:DUF3842 family protein [Clostridiales bacterium]
MKILLIDGQGGKIGRELTESILERFPDVDLTVVGTNTIATTSMIKGGAKNAATGENAVIVGSRKADIIVGPIGIVIADSLLGEITPEMALAVARSEATKILIPMTKCDNLVAGIKSQSISDLIEDILNKIADIIDKQ